MAESGGGIEQTAGLPKLSTYGESLPEEAKKRYVEKLSLIGGFDPMCGVPHGSKLLDIDVDIVDLHSYLVLDSNFITGDQFKARKALGAYNQFVQGWIKELKSFEVASLIVTYGRVS